MDQLNLPINDTDVREEILRIRPYYEEVLTRIQESCRESGRNAEDIRLIAVTKYHSPAAAAAALHLGIKDLAENRVVPFLERRALLAAYCEQHGLEHPTWHFVGSLQRNKVKQLAGSIGEFHALDSLRLARRISTVYEERGEILPVYLQVNVTGETSKHGFESVELMNVIRDLLGLPGIHVRGLMTMAEQGATAGRLKETFRRLADLGAEVSTVMAKEGQLQPHEQLRLSMGMSGDYQFAVSAGATDLRLGSALFGPRQDLA